MQKLTVLTILVLSLASPASASRLVTIHAGKHTARVAQNAASNFQGLLNDLAAHGYPIKFLGGWRKHGSCRGCDMHPRGLALDVNQLWRDHVSIPLSRALAHKLAQAHGLVSGGDWCHGDLGHFELASASRATHNCRGIGAKEFLAKRKRSRRKQLVRSTPKRFDLAAQPAYPE